MSTYHALNFECVHWRKQIPTTDNKKNESKISMMSSSYIGIAILLGNLEKKWQVIRGKQIY